MATGIVYRYKGHMDTGWKTLSWTSGGSFKSYNDNSANAPRYKKIGHMVFFRAIAVTTASISDGVAFTLPAGFRPFGDVALINYAGGRKFLIRIKPSGNVIAERYSTTASENFPSGTLIDLIGSFVTA